MKIMSLPLRFALDFYLFCNNLVTCSSPNVQSHGSKNKLHFHVQQSDNTDYNQMKIRCRYFISCHD